MADQVAPYLLRQTTAAPAGPVERVWCAYRIPFLPDFVSSRGTTGQTERDLLGWALGNQAGIIGALARWKEQAFAIRFLFRPERSTIEMALVLRAVAPAGQGAPLAMALGHEVTQLLAGAGIALVPVTTDGDLRALLDPPGHVYITEVRQREDLVPLRMGDAYVVYPFQPPMSSWLTLFESLMRQPAPCAINVHLQPTRLAPEEQTNFEQAASLARGLEHLQHQGDLADPQAAVVGGLYADYLRRLTDPLLLVTQVASPDAQVAHMIARMLVPELSHSMELRAAQANGQLPHGAEVVTPRTPPEAAAAHATLAFLEPQFWGATAALPAQHRLRFLTDAPTATAAFRFPVATRDAIPGVALRAPAASGARQTGSKIFLSYRRDDSGPTTGRIYDRLANHFGKEAIFIDVSNIPLGVDFMSHIRQTIEQCAVQLVVIGPRWLDITDAQGARRLDNPEDPVRQEVEVGLASEVLVIPLLVDGASTPIADSLPTSLRAIPALNSRPVRHMDFDYDLRIIIAAIEERMRRGPQH
ncbi:MAG TPA: toll/interleukin-1 receptor domain-containing protein [Ktedonobacterales bacterium]|nr:toll/interleukin-1 receptor domain-containing protein [Ktedonobacterales bacterium]